MREHEGWTKGEELLSQVLEECLEEDLSFIPPEREIARKHRFSEHFEQEMQKLLEDSTASLQKRKIQKHFVPRYGQLVACVLVFVVCGSLLYQVMRGSFSGSSSDSTAYLEEAAEDTAAGAQADAGADAASEETAPQEAFNTEEEISEEASEEGAEQTKEYCGRTVYLAKHQEVPDELEDVTTLVNCPVLDEEHTILYLTIGNTKEEDIKYWNQHKLEVWLTDGWYQVPEHTPKEEGEWVTLEAGMAVDEEIDLTAYPMDYDAKYRLITKVGEEFLCAEFTFEDVFTKTMEELEE